MLDFIDHNSRIWLDRLLSWSSINSGTYNLDGLARLADALRRACAALGADHEAIDLPAAESIDEGGNVVRARLGKGLRFVKRPTAPKQVFLCIHYDTVYPPDSTFQSPRWIDDATLNGPGVADAKGGIAVMLSALEAFEARCLDRDRLGWEIYFNPDEEIGSPGSMSFLRDVASRHKLALLFEPALPDGSLVGARKGSGNFTAIVRGRAAHAGRDFHAGRSATVALAELIVKIDALNGRLGDVTINCGRIEGGGAVNVVSDLAIARFNARVSEPQQVARVEEAMKQIGRDVESARDGIRVEWHGGFASPPKVFDDRARRLFELIAACAQELRLGDLSAKPSGGASDGNKLAAAGVANIDSMGPVGGEIHSDREFVRVETIAQRAKLTALVLQKIAQGASL